MADVKSVAEYFIKLSTEERTKHMIYRDGLNGRSLNHLLYFCVGWDSRYDKGKFIEDVSFKAVVWGIECVELSRYLKLSPAESAFYGIKDWDRDLVNTLTTFEKEFIRVIWKCYGGIHWNSVYDRFLINDKAWLYGREGREPYITGGRKIPYSKIVEQFSGLRKIINKNIK